MEKSESIKSIALAILKFQGLVGKINKDSNNPFYKSAYASLPDILSAIHQPMIDAGLILNQFPTGLNGLTTILIHAESGEYMLDTYEMTPVKSDPQSRGSSITYQRRYAVGAVLSLNIDEDDDGNKASTPPKIPSQPTPPKATPAQLKLVSDCKTVETLQKVWDDNSGLHTNNEFKVAVTAKKGELSK